MTLNFNIKQQRYTYSNLQIVLNNVELVSIGKKKSRFFDFWPHDFDFSPLWAVQMVTAELHYERSKRSFLIDGMSDSRATSST